jgi:type VI secretion system protein VasD
MVHIWQLKSRARFDKADYDTLLTQEESTLNGMSWQSTRSGLNPKAQFHWMFRWTKRRSLLPSGQFYQPDEKHNTWRLILTRDDLDADKPRTIELLRSQLTLLPIQDN